MQLCGVLYSTDNAEWLLGAGSRSEPAPIFIILNTKNPKTILQLSKLKIKILDEVREVQNF